MAHDKSALQNRTGGFVGALMLISGIAALVGGSLAASWQKILDVFR